MAGEGSILVIDDDLDYTCLLQEAFQQAHVTNPIEVINDSWAIVDYLKRLGTDLPRSSNRIPALVLLDWRMPGFCGLDVLRALRSNACTADVPVVVLTGILVGDECAQAKSLGVASVQDKPFSYRELVHTVEQLRARFLTSSELERVA